MAARFLTGDEVFYPDASAIEASVSIERNLLRKTAQMLGAVVCCLGLSFASAACVSPDLEPPGATGARSAVPSTPGVPQNGMMTAKAPSAGSVAERAAAAGTSAAAMSTPGNTLATAGQTAKPAMGTTAPGAPTTPPPTTAAAGAAATTSTGAAAGAGAGAPADPNNDADAGTP